MSNIHIVQDAFVTIDGIEGTRHIPFSDLSPSERRNLHAYSMLSVDDAARASANGDHPAAEVFVKYGIAPSGVYDVIVDCRVRVAAFVLDADKKVLVCGPEQDRESLSSALADMWGNAWVAKPDTVEPATVEPATVEPATVEPDTAPKFYAADYAEFGLTCTTDMPGTLRMAWDIHTFPSLQERNKFVQDAPDSRLALTAKNVTKFANGVPIYVTPAQAKKSGVKF